MKSYIVNSIIIAAVISVFASCKKGENDPFISFRSRKARVAGEWNCVSGYGSRTYPSSPSDNGSWVFENGKYTYTENGTSETIDRRLAYTFEKDGTFKFADVVNKEVVTGKGKWDLQEGVGDVKKKSRIDLYFTTLEFPTSGTFFFHSNEVDRSYHLDELRHEKMVWHKTITVKPPDGIEYTDELHYVFETK